MSIWRGAARATARPSTAVSEMSDECFRRQRSDFEAALGRIEAFVSSEIDHEAGGVALFSRAGERAFFLPLQFRPSVPNSMSVDTVPNIYDLVELKDTFDRYVLVISTETKARIMEVSLGSVTRELWAERPELRKRVGREWFYERYQSHRRDRSEKFIKEKIEILDRLVSEGGHTHLLLAGNPRMIARVRNNLPKRLAAMVIDLVPLSGAAPTSDAVLATLANFAEHEQGESLETAGLLLDELRRGALAVAGTDPTLDALARGQVDVLVLASAYTSPAAWACQGCGALESGEKPTACPRCGERAVREADLKEEIVRLAERSGTTIEIVRDSDVLFDIGGVGCLLRYRMPHHG